MSLLTDFVSQLNLLLPSSSSKKSKKSTPPPNAAEVVTQLCKYLDGMEEQYSTVKECNKYTLQAKLLRQRITILTTDLICVLAAQKDAASLDILLTSGVCCEDEMITVIAIYHPNHLQHIVNHTERLLAHLTSHTHEWMNEARKENSVALMELVTDIDAQQKRDERAKLEVKELCKKFRCTKVQLQRILEEMEVDEE